jgi:DNA-binding phage protein
VINMNPHILYLSTAIVLSASIISPCFQEKVGFQGLTPPTQSPGNIGAVNVQKGERRRLSDGKAIEAIMAKVLKEGDPKQSRGTIETTDEGRSLGLAMQAEVLGLTPEEIDRAIREWGRKTEDRYLQGLAALYEKNYQTATRLLTQTYEKRKDSGQQDGADLAARARDQGADAG